VKSITIIIVLFTVAKYSDAGMELGNLSGLKVGF
jgi:hypothetical protein